MAAKSRAEDTMQATIVECELEDMVQGAKAVNLQAMPEDVLKLAREVAAGKLELLSENNGIKMLISGKTGVGKSTLVNGLLGEEVAEVCLDLTTTGVTDSVTPYDSRIENLNVVVYDSPGLQDGSGNEEKYLEMLYSACKHVDLVIFAIRLEMRFVPGNPDAKAMVAFTQKFGPSVWKKTIVVLTCSNLALQFNLSLRQQDDATKKKHFKKLMADYKVVIHNILSKEAKLPQDIVENIKVVPAGHELEPKLLDGTLWFSNLWFECLKTVQNRDAQTYLIKANASRLRSQKSVKDEDFNKPLREQPIVLPTLSEEVKDGLKGLGTVSAIAIPASVGAAIGAVGLVAGPLGALTIPIGGFLGMTAGLLLLAAKAPKSAKSS